MQQIKKIVEATTDIQRLSDSLWRRTMKKAKDQPKPDVILQLRTLSTAIRPPKIDPTDIAAQIEVVIKEVDKGRGAAKISEKYGIDPALVEQIARLYLTHPGVTVDGIMTKMGL